MSKISELGTITGANTRSEDLFVIVNLVQGDDGTKNITRKELVEAIQYEIFSRITITGGTISGVVMSDSRLDNVIIDNSDIEDTDFVRGSIDRTEITNSDANNIVMSYSSFQLGTIFATTANTMTITNSDFSDGTANNIVITQSEFNDGTGNNVVLNNSTIDSSTFQNGDMSNVDGDNIRLANSSFTDGTISNSTANNIVITQSEFNDGTVNNTVISSSEFNSGTMSTVVGVDVSLSNSDITTTDISASNFYEGNISNTVITTSEFNDGTVNNTVITQSEFNDGTGNNVVLTNSTIDYSVFQNGSISNTSFAGTMDGVVANDLTITSSSADGLSSTNSSFDNGTLSQSTFSGGVIDSSQLVDFDMELTKEFEAPIDEESYFAIRNEKTGETEQISYKQLFNEVSKSTQSALKVSVDAAKGNDEYPGTELQPVRTLERACELALEKAGGSYDRNSLNNAVHIEVGQGTYYTKGELAIPDDCAVTSKAGQYATVIEALPGYENNNCWLVGSGNYVQGFAYMNWKIDNFDYPEGGFAVAYRPGAKLLRSPYIRDSSQLSNFNRVDVEPPLNPYNSKGTLDDLGREFTLSNVSAVSGFAVDDEITFSSGAVGFVSYVSELASDNKIHIRNLKNNKGFAVGDTITSESGGTATIDAIGIDDFPNRLVGRGGGCLLADRRVLDPDSLYTYVLCFGFTPRSQNGMGYVARDGAGVNGIGSLSIFVRCAFYALNGGQMTLNNSGTQFGDISMRAKGTTQFFAPKSTNATIFGNTVFADTIENAYDDIVDDMVEYLTANSANGGLGYTGYDAGKCERDSRIIVDGLGYDIALDSNYWGRLAGITYRSPISYIVPGDQLEETLGANQYLQSRVESIFEGSTEIINRANTSMQELYNVLQYGEENMNPITWVDSGKVERTAARELLQDNRSFIQDELTDWIDNNDEFFAYDSVKCRRDVTEYILPAVKYDMLLETNYNAVTAGNAYYMNAAKKVIDKQRDETISAYRRLKDQTNEILDANSYIGSARSDEAFDEIIGILEGDGGRFAQVDASYTPTDATYDPVTGIMTVTIGSHNFAVGDSFFIKPNGMTFSCGSGVTISHPRTTDPFYNKPYVVLNKTATTVTVQAGDANGYTGAHTFVSAYKDAITAASDVAWTPIDGTYDAETGIAVLTLAGRHGLSVGDKVILKPGSISFSCEGDGTVTTLSHPRVGDPAYRSPLEIEATTPTSITINVGPAAYVAPHTFVSADVNSVILASSKIRFSDNTNIISSKRNARIQLQNNKNFIQDHMMGYIDYNYFRYDSEKCERDVIQHILPAIERDIITGTNFNAKQAGVAYRQGNQGTLRNWYNERPETVGAFNELKQLIANNTITDAASIHRSDESFRQLIDIVESKGKSYTPTNGTYDPLTGITSLTIGAHDFKQGDKIVLDDLSLTWQCGSPSVNIVHPRPTDPAYRTPLTINKVTSTTIEFNAGDAGGYTGAHTFVAADADCVKAATYIPTFSLSTATYDPITGEFEATIGQHSFVVGDYVEIKPESVVFECNSIEIVHPRPTDPAYKTPVKITGITSTTITMNVGDANGYTGAHTFVRADDDCIVGDPIIWTDPSNYLQYYTPTTATYDPVTGISVVTIPGHNLLVDDYIEFAPYSLTFTCASDGNATEHSYPRKGDGNYNTPMRITTVAGDDITVNVGVGAGGAHTFVSAANHAVAKVTYNSDGQRAAEQLQINRNMIQDEIMAYLDDNYFVFDGAKCSRDTGLILDAIRRDVATGSNYNAVFAGLSYQLGSGSINLVVSDQLPQTTGSINFLKSEIANELTGNSLTRANAAFDEIIDILNNGTGNADVLTFGTNTVSANHTTARTALQLNKAFLAAEVTAYIAQTWPNLVYDVAKCERDTGFLIDAVSWDIQHGSNAASVNFARMYYDNAISVLPGDQILPTAKTWAHIAEVCYQIVRDQAVSVTSGNAATQDVSQTDAGIAVANKVKELVEITTNVIRDNTLTWLPEYVEPIIETGYADAVNKIDGQTEVLQDDVIGYVRREWKGLPYDKATCRRDVGLIIDAVSKDIIYGGNANTIEAAKYYFRLDNEISADLEQLRSINVLPIEVSGQFRDTAETYKTANVSGLRTLINILPEEQRIPTKLAFQRLADVASDVVQEISITPSANNVPTQDTSGTPADAATGTAVHDLIEIIANVVDDASDENLTTTQVDPTVDSNRTQARKQIQLNKDFIAADTIAYLRDKYFTFDGDKCKRDIETIVKAVARDVLADSNFNSVFNGLAYRSGTAGTNLVVNEQLTETIKGVEYARDIAVRSITDDGARERAQAAFNEIIDIMGNNTPDTISFGAASQAGANGINAREQLQNNKAFMQAEMTAWIAQNYGSLVYDSAKCERDLGYIIDSVTWDAMHGGNVASRWNANIYFENAVAILPEDQRAPTAAAFAHIATVAELVVQDSAVTKTTGNAENQSFASGNAGAAMALKVRQMFELVSDAIDNDGIDSLPAEELPNLAGYQAEYQTAYAQLVTSISGIQDGILTYLARFFEILPYDEDKCRRDIGYVLDAVSHDIQYGGNAATLNAAYMYFDNAVSTLPVFQREASKKAFTHVSNLVEQCVRRLDVDQTDWVKRKFGVSTATYSPTTGETVITTTSPHYMSVGDHIIIAEEGITFECGSPAVQISHPRRTDPAFKKPLEITAVTSNTFTVNTGYAKQYTGAHTFVSAIPNAILQIDGNIEKQDQTQIAGSPEIAIRAQNLVKIVANVVDKGSYVSFPDRVDPVQTWQRTPYVASKELIEDESVNLAASILNYISNVHNGLSFPEQRCRRDIGYLIDAISHDIQYDGNYATRIAAQIYFDWGVSVLPADTRTQTADVYNYLGTVLDAVVQEDGSIANTTYTDTPFDTTGTPATAVEGARVSDLIGIVEDVIRANSLDSMPGLVQPTTAWVASDVIGAAQQIDDNLEILANDMIEYINTEFDVLDYNRDKCRRDVGYLLDAFSYDLNYGGNIASRWNADFYFWNNQYRVPEDQRVATAKAYKQLGVICKDIVVGKYPNQVALGELGTQVEAEKVQNLANIFYKTQFFKDTKYLPAKEEPDYTYSGDQFTSAQFILEQNKLDLAFDVVRFVNSTYDFIDIGLTRRDGYNLLEAITNDFRYEDASAGTPVYGDVAGSQKSTRSFTAAFFDQKGQHTFPVFNPSNAAYKYQGSVEQLSDLAAITGQKPNHAYIVASNYATNHFAGDIYYWNGTTWVLDGPNDTSLLDAFTGAWDRMRDYIVDNLSPNSQHDLMVEGLFNDCLKDNILRPETLVFGSLVESIAHQFNGASAGVNRNALPLNFRNLGSAISAVASVLSEDGGRIRWSGADELNNQYFARGLRINGRTGRIEGRPFTSSVRKLARRASNSRAVI